MMVIDGSFGEGGGQILRSSLSLSLVTGKPFRIENIRSGRKKPGLMQQHLTAVDAAATVGQAQVRGNVIGSDNLSFIPTTIKPGRYKFMIGTAGSTTLVLQTVLPALIIAEGKSQLTLEGGTHNPYSPPYDFLEKTFLPIINRMGPTLLAVLERPGFYPAGGGSFSISIDPVRKLNPIDILERGEVCKYSVKAVVSKLPQRIGEREIEVVREELGWSRECMHVQVVSDSAGPGNILGIEIESEHITEVFTGFGTKGKPAHQVAKSTTRLVEDYLTAGVPVGKHLADQLLIPMAIAGHGVFRTLALTSHAQTNIEVLKRFLDKDITVSILKNGVCEIGIS